MKVYCIGFLFHISFLFEYRVYPQNIFYSNDGLIHQIESVNIQRGQIDMGI